jgi:hypothetical protein
VTPVAAQVYTSDSAQPPGSGIRRFVTWQLFAVFAASALSVLLAAKTGWWERFPPAGAEIVSWNVVMGIGQIVTLRLPPKLLNVVNVEIERCAWGVFATEFYPAYDFVPVRERLKREWLAKRAEGKG